LVKKGFPNFGITQSGAFVAALKNYNLPDFVLSLLLKIAIQIYWNGEELMIDFLV